MTSSRTKDRAASGTATAPGGASADRDGDRPLYLQIVEALQREIVAGVYPVGTALPSEAVLVNRFEVSRHTVREALRSLRESGLVSSRQGLRTLVKRHGDSGGYVHQVSTISDLFPLGVETMYEPVDGALVGLPAGVSLKGALTGDPAWLRIRATRRRRGEGSPFNELDAFVGTRFAGVGRSIGAHAGPIYGLIEALYGVSIGEVEQVFGAFEADGEAGGALGMQPGDTGLQIQRIFRLVGSGEVAMISFNRYLPDSFSFSMILRKVRE